MRIHKWAGKHLLTPVELPLMEVAWAQITDSVWVQKPGVVLCIRDPLEQAFLQTQCCNEQLTPTCKVNRIWFRLRTSPSRIPKVARLPSTIEPPPARCLLQLTAIKVRSKFWGSLLTKVSYREEVKFWIPTQLLFKFLMQITTTALPHQTETRILSHLVAR